MDEGASSACNALDVVESLPEIAKRPKNKGYFNGWKLPLVTAGARRPEGTPPGASFFLFAPTLGARLIFPHRGK